jgi:uncharacterized membrane protein
MADGQDEEARPRPEVTAEEARPLPDATADKARSRAEARTDDAGLRPETSVDAPTGRLLVLADGVFAIAITLLVLDISVRQNLPEAEFRRALSNAVPELLAYGLSFLVISAVWRDHRRLLRGLRHVDERLVQLVLLGLGLIALLPFPTSLLAEYGSRPESVVIYSATVAAINAVHLGVLLYLWRHPALVYTPVRPAVVRAFTMDFGTTIAVFLVTIPLAYASPTWAKVFWVVLIPARVAVNHFGVKEET